MLKKRPAFFLYFLYSGALAAMDGTAAFLLPQIVDIILSKIEEAMTVDAPLVRCALAPQRNGSDIIIEGVACILRTIAFLMVFAA